eukprot:4988295-Prymnesium_polylepis.2
MAECELSTRAPDCGRESAGLGQHIYPYTYLQAPHHRAWNHSELNWPPSGRLHDSIWTQHRVSWVRSAASPVSSMATAPRPRAFAAPDGHPQQRAWSWPEPVMWLRLRPLPPLVGLRKLHSQPAADRDSRARDCLLYTSDAADDM